MPTLGATAPQETSSPWHCTCAPLQEYRSIVTSLLAMFEHQFGGPALPRQPVVPVCCPAVRSTDLRCRDRKSRWRLATTVLALPPRPSLQATWR